MRMAVAFPHRNRFLRILLMILAVGLLSQNAAWAQTHEYGDSAPNAADLRPEDDDVPAADEAAPTEPPVVSAPVLLGVEPIKEPERIGLRIIAEKPTPYQMDLSVAATRLAVTFPEARFNTEPPAEIPVGSDVALQSLAIAPWEEQGTQLTLTLAYGVPDWSDTGWTRIDGGLYKLVITAQRRFVRRQEYLLQQGVTLITQQRGDPAGPISVQALRFSSQNPQVRFGIGLAGGYALNLETVPTIARRYGAYAAVNATYFHTSGLALGLLVDNYTLISTPVYDRTALLVLADGSMGMDRAALQAFVNLADGRRIAVHGFNRSRKTGEVVVYNKAFGAYTPKDPNARELVIEKGVVTAVVKGGNTPITPGVTVVAHDTQSLLVLTQPGDSALVTWDLQLLGYQQVVPGYLVRLAVSGGPRLVADGKVQITGVEEQFRTDVTQGRAPRTALGITADNQILLVTVDGRRNNHSIGMTLEELAALMLELGAVQAMNLDGGGSTTMVIDGRVVNIPSDGNPRAVSSALLVYTLGAPPDEEPSEGGATE